MFIPPVYNVLELSVVFQPGLSFAFALFLIICPNMGPISLPLTSFYNALIACVACAEALAVAYLVEVLHGGKMMPSATKAVAYCALTVPVLMLHCLWLMSKPWRRLPGVLLNEAYALLTVALYRFGSPSAGTTTKDTHLYTMGKHLVWFFCLASGTTILIGLIVFPVDAGSRARQALAAGARGTSQVLRRIVGIATGPVKDDGTLAAAAGESDLLMDLDLGLREQAVAVHADAQRAGLSLLSALMLTRAARCDVDVYRRTCVLPGEFSWKLGTALNDLLGCCVTTLLLVETGGADATELAQSRDAVLAAQAHLSRALDGVADALENNDKAADAVHALECAVSVLEGLVQRAEGTDEGVANVAAGVSAGASPSPSRVVFSLIVSALVSAAGRLRHVLRLLPAVIGPEQPSSVEVVKGMLERVPEATLLGMQRRLDAWQGSGGPGGVGNKKDGEGDADGTDLSGTHLRNDVSDAWNGEVYLASPADVWHARVNSLAPSDPVEGIKLAGLASPQTVSGLSRPIAAVGTATDVALSRRPPTPTPCPAAAPPTPTLLEHPVLAIERCVAAGVDAAAMAIWTVKERVVGALCGTAGVVIGKGWKEPHGAASPSSFAPIHKHPASLPSVSPVFYTRPGMQLGIQLGLCFIVIMVVHACDSSYYAFDRRTVLMVPAVFVLIEPTSGASIRKSVGRVFGTMVGAGLALAIVYLTFACNGRSYEDRPQKFVFHGLFMSIAVGVQCLLCARYPSQSNVINASLMSMSIGITAGYLDSTPLWSYVLWRALMNVLGAVLVSIITGLVLPVRSSELVTEGFARVLVGLGGALDALGGRVESEGGAALTRASDDSKGREPEGGAGDSGVGAFVSSSLEVHEPHWRETAIEHAFTAAHRLSASPARETLAVVSPPHVVVSLSPQELLGSERVGSIGIDAAVRRFDRDGQDKEPRGHASEDAVAQAKNGAKIEDARGAKAPAAEDTPANRLPGRESSVRVGDDSKIAGDALANPTSAGPRGGIVVKAFISDVPLSHLYDPSRPFYRRAFSILATLFTPLAPLDESCVAPSDGLFGPAGLEAYRNTAQADLTLLQVGGLLPALRYDLPHVDMSVRRGGGSGGGEGGASSLAAASSALCPPCVRCPPSPSITFSLVRPMSVEDAFVSVRTIRHMLTLITSSSRDLDEHGASSVRVPRRVFPFVDAALDQCREAVDALALTTSKQLPPLEAARLALFARDAAERAATRVARELYRQRATERSAEPVVQAARLASLAALLISFSNILLQFVAVGTRAIYGQGSDETREAHDFVFQARVAVLGEEVGSEGWSEELRKAESKGASQEAPLAKGWVGASEDVQRCGAKPPAPRRFGSPQTFSSPSLSMALSPPTGTASQGPSLAQTPPVPIDLGLSPPKGCVPGTGPQAGAGIRRRRLADFLAADPSAAAPLRQLGVGFVDNADRADAEVSKGLPRLFLGRRSKAIGLLLRGARSSREGEENGAEDDQ